MIIEEFPSVEPSELSSYAQAKGWTMIRAALDDRKYVFNHPRFENVQLNFPMDMDYPDYKEAMYRAVTRLAEVESSTLMDAFSRVKQLSTDTVYLRVHGLRDETDFLPLDYASRLVSGSQNMVLAAASSVVKPRPHHPRLSFGNAQALLSKTQFRHTARGSFTFRISCPLFSVDSPLLLDDNETFARQTTRTIQESMLGLVSSLEENALQSFVTQLTQTDQPTLSSNFCEAVASFGDEELGTSVDVSFDWSSLIPPPPHLGRAIRIQNSFFPRIAEVGSALKSRGSDQSGPFIATVEGLHGDLGEDGRRSGEVILALFLPEEDVIRAKAYLDAEQYEVAYEAHKGEGKYIKLNGILKPGRQPREIKNISEFIGVS